MQPNPHYRYVRGLARDASLFAVTEAGIDEFLAAPDATRPGVVVLARDGEDGGDPDVRFLGGPRLAGILARLHADEPDALAEARPLAVVSVASGDGDLWVGAALARTLRSLASRRAGDVALGRYGELAAELPEAVRHVIGLDPFHPGATLN